jgi:hypothetical protein
MLVPHMRWILHQMLVVMVKMILVDLMRSTRSVKRSTGSGLGPVGR